MCVLEFFGLNSKQSWKEKSKGKVGVTERCVCVFCPKLFVLSCYSSYKK